MELHRIVAHLVERQERFGPGREAGILRDKNIFFGKPERKANRQLHALHSQFSLGHAFLHRIHFRLQVQQVHLRNIRVVVVEGLLELFVSAVHLLLRIAGKPPHFLGEQVIVVVSLQLHVFLVDFLLDTERFLLQVRFQCHLAGTILSEIERLDELTLDTPERAHLGKVIHVHGIAPVVHGFLQTGSGADHRRNVERRENDLRRERIELFLLFASAKTRFGKQRVFQEAFFHKMHTVVTDFAGKGQSRHKEDCNKTHHILNLAKKSYNPSASNQQILTVGRKNLI